MEHKKGKCPCGCKEFREASRLAFVIYDPRHTFAARAAESGMPLGTLAKILGHSDLRSVMKYVHVGQEAQDRAIEQFEAHEAAQNIRQRNVRPVSVRSMRLRSGICGISRDSPGRCK